MNIQYTLTPKRESSLDNDEIISLLSEYQALSRPITIMNYYRELPITSVSSLSQVTYGKFEISLSQIHMEVIREQMQTILCLEGCTALADCSSVNYQKKRLIVSGCSFIELHATKRQAFRLNMDADLVVDFRNQHDRLSARMVDISITGCRIKYDAGNVVVGLLVVLEIQIFDASKNREVSRSIAAKVVNVYEGDGVNYCSLEFIGTPSDEDLLARYINQQQMSLIRELR